MSNPSNHNELEHLAPHLARLPKVEPFEAPEGYFEQLPVELIQKIQDGKTVYSIEKTEEFETPPGYFEGLSDSVLTKIKQNKTEKSIYTMRGGWLRKLAVAASIALVAVFSYHLFFNKNQPTIVASNTTKASVDQCQQYLADELPVQELEDYLNEQNIEITDDQSNNQAVVDYLMNESEEFELDNL